MQPLGDHLRAAVEGYLACRFAPRLHHPLRAKDLDALIVAIGGAAAVVDVTERSAWHLQNEHRGVNIPRLTNGRVNQNRTSRVYLNRSLVGKPAGQVEKVDGLVPELATRHFDVADGRRLLSA